MSVAASTVCKHCGRSTGFSDAICAACRNRKGHGLPYIDPHQMALPGIGPAVGERYRNRSTDTIVTVVGVAQRKYGWVTFRVLEAEQTTQIASFLRNFTRI